MTTSLAPSPATPRVTLITGGSAGIGAAAARRLLALGHRVAVTGRSEERLKQFADEIGEPDNLLPLPGDAADPDTVEQAVEATVARFGRLDAAVANAAFATFDSLADGDPDGWREMVLTNVLGPALLFRAALPRLRATGGRIVMVGSVTGFVGVPGNLYGATKWAVTGLAENARLLATREGVGVTLLAPGRVGTDFWEAGGGAPAGVPLLTPAQVAESIAWAVDQPAGVDVNTLVVRPIGQEI